MPNPEASIEDLVWLGCAIDTEGCIMAFYDTRANRARIPKVKLQFVNTNWKLVQKFKAITAQITGRRIVARHRLPTNLSKLDRWEIQIDRASAIEQILKVVRPYIVGKTEQADGALQILAWRKTTKRTHLEGCVPPEVFQAADRIKYRNHRPFHPNEAVETIGETVETEEIVQNSL